MALGSSFILRDVIANIPSASTIGAGRLFISTDENKIYRDNGSTWDEILISPSGDASLDQLTLNDGSELTISSGAITVTHARHTVDTESDSASDDLATISGTSAGETFILSANNTARTVVLKDGSDNIICASGADITLDETYKAVLCVSDGTNVTAYPIFSGGSGTIGGTLGSTDNAIPRADGTGGSTIQASGLVIDNNDSLQMADNVIQQAEMLDYSETFVADTDSGSTHTIDIETANHHSLTLTDNCTLTFSNPSPTGKACSFTLRVIQDGTGSRTLTYPASVEWAGGIAPTLTTDADAVDFLTFLTYDAGTTWYGFPAGLDFS